MTITCGGSSKAATLGPQEPKTKQVGGRREDDEGAHFVRDPIRTTEDAEMRRFAGSWLVV
jgi:hypothetical protein